MAGSKDAKEISCGESSLITSFSSPDSPTDLQPSASSGADHSANQTVDENSSSVATEIQIDNDLAAPDVIKTSPARPHMLTVKVNHNQVDFGSPRNKTPGSVGSPDLDRLINLNRGLIDTAAPFESVKEAVSKFGGIVDWKAHKALTIERRKNIEAELEKAQEEIPDYRKRSEAAEDAKAEVLKELDSTKRLIEDLKLSLERARTEEAQAKQDAELAQLRAKEMEQGIANDASVAAKAQLDVSKARYEAAVTELKSVKDEIKELKEKYVHLTNEREMAVRKAEEAISASREIEKTVEDLTLELMSTKESLETAHAAHLEAEEHRICAVLAREQGHVNWEKELQRAQRELEQCNDELLVTKDLESKLDAASTLLSSLKAELAAYVESELNQEFESSEKEKFSDSLEQTQEDSTSVKTLLAKELEEVKINIEKAKEEVKYLSVAASSLKCEVERHNEELTTIRQKEGMASAEISSLEAELNRTETELELVLTKEKEVRAKTADLPKFIQQAAQEADQAKSLATLAHEELRKAKEEAEQAKAAASTMDIRLHASLKEIEAAKASEVLALAAVKTLEERELSGTINKEDSPSVVILPLDEYYMLSERGHEAEELASERVIAAIEQIKLAQKSESSILEKLEEANKMLDEKKEALKAATEKADEANEGKLGVEQELRNWRSEHEQKRKANEASQSMSNPSRSTRTSVDGREASSSTEEVDIDASPSMSYPKVYKSASDTESVVPESTKMKKKSFFPRIVMFLARKKAQSLK